MKRLALMLTLAVACSSGAVATGGYVMAEGSIVGPEVLAAGGETVFHISNVGEFGHTFVVTNADGKVLGATDVLPPGAEVGLTLDLVPGQYQVSCRLVTQDGDGNLIDHYEVGMYQNIRVEGS
jgi:uncharacterized cupredoxin-like copper-binding protein